MQTLIIWNLYFRVSEAQEVGVVMMESLVPKAIPDNPGHLDCKANVEPKVLMVPEDFLALLDHQVQMEKMVYQVHQENEGHL